MDKIDDNLRQSAKLLRKLTLRSKLGFGKHSELTVKDIIDLRKKSYLRWIYYNLVGITFSDEILEEIQIPNEYRIKKPGNCPGMLDELNEIVVSPSISIKTKMHKNKVYKYQKSAKLRQIGFKEKRLNSKYFNRTRNQK